MTPIIEDERTLVPVRFIAENLGGTVSYDAATGDIVISVDSNEIQMTVDEKEMVVNGESIELDVPARTYHDRTMIPLRAMVEAVGKKVFWDDSGLIIISDRENIFNANTEIQYIDYVARQLTGRERCMCQGDIPMYTCLPDGSGKMERTDSWEPGCLETVYGHRR